MSNYYHTPYYDEDDILNYYEIRRNGTNELVAKAFPEFHAEAFILVLDYIDSLQTEVDQVGGTLSRLISRLGLGWLLN